MDVQSYERRRRELDKRLNEWNRRNRRKEACKVKQLTEKKIRRTLDEGKGGGGGGGTSDGNASLKKRNQRNS